ncbi:TetR/AcrR family transcriptional regulator [Leptothrix sp. BB-4]
MPRGRSATYADQHEAILAHAAELFAARGYPGTSMNEVATACGLTKPALYHYVRDKEALLLQICQQHIARLQALVASVQAQGLVGEALLRALILAFVRAYADAQGEHRVLTEDVRFLGDAERAVVLEGQRQVVAAFADAVAQVRPALAAASLHKPLTMLLFGMINWMFTWLQPDGPLTHDDMAPVVADLFVGGLQALQPQPHATRA